MLLHQSFLPLRVKRQTHPVTGYLAFPLMSHFYLKTLPLAVNRKLYKLEYLWAYEEEMVR